jgi:hypothetical protein
MKLLFVKFTLVLSIFGCPAVMGQQKSLDTLVRKFDAYRRNNFQEKIYVHADQNFYVTGETMWFKVISVDGTFNKPLSLSKVAYVEILDRKNVSLLQARVELKDGFGNGTFFLPASLASGSYTLRAYTQWMKNYSPEFFFHKTITIVNTFIKIEPDQEPAKNDAVVSFFPEGGHLVKGVRSKIAFKVTDRKGASLDCKGAVINTQHDTLTSFTTLRSGIGSFYYTPSAASTESVVITLPNHSTSAHKLPVANEVGYVMSVTDAGQSIKIKVVGRFSSPRPASVYLFAHARQIIAFAAVQPLYNDTTTFSIDKNKLAVGITHLTLFEESLTPVCERLYFKHPSNKLTVQLSTDQRQYDVRRKIKVDLATFTHEKPSEAQLSVSVFKLDSLSTAENCGLYEYLWLASELAGKIEDPQFYFSDSPQAPIAIENLLLTHGWRRFSWDNILNKKNDHKFLPEFRGQIVSATVTDTEGKPQSGALVYLSVPSKVIRLYPSRSNDRGELNFELHDYYGSRQVVAQAADSTNVVTIQSPLASAFASYLPAPFSLSSSSEQNLTARSISMQVRDVYYENNRFRYKYPVIDSTGFYGVPDETYYLDDYTRFPVMEEVMREYVKGVFVRKKRDGFHFIVLDNVNKTSMQQTPMIMLDGMPVLNTNKIMNFDPRKVKKLEVVTRPYYLGTQTFSGIVSYTTYAGDLGGFQIDPNSVALDYDGLQLQREFFSPEYETQKQRANRTPDQRNLLFWSPEVSTTETGKRQLEFFSSDTEGTFLIRTEGITKDGSAGSGWTMFTVKRFDN